MDNIRQMLQVRVHAGQAEIEVLADIATGATAKVVAMAIGDGATNTGVYDLEAGEATGSLQQSNNVDVTASFTYGNCNSWSYFC